MSNEKMASQVNQANERDEINRLFEDDSSGSEGEFEGFQRHEIYGMYGGDSDSEAEPGIAVDSDAHASESDIADSSDEQSSDSEAYGDRRVHAAAGWVACAEGDAIIRQHDVPQHAIGDALRPTMQYPMPPTELDIFSEFFTDGMIDIMVLQTNLYAAQWQAKPNLPRNARIHRWVDTDANEMRAFIALRIAMGLSPRNQAGDYFTSSSSFWLTDTPNYVRVMPKHRFQALASCLHFVNNEEQIRDRNHQDYNPLYKIQPLIDIVAENWRTAVEPAKHASIDESMIPFRGRVRFRQYIKSKHHRYGVKGFALCDASTCYCIKYDIYTGRHYDYDRDLGQGCSVVQKLARDMPEGTIFYTDSFYTSPTLATQLMQMNMGLVGTVQKNRRGMPEALKARPTQDAKFVFKDPILAVSFKDRNDVRMLSTVHDARMNERQTRATANERLRNIGDENGIIRTRLPFMTGAYNKYMRGVDGLDQLLSYNAYPHRTRKWYVKVFNYFLDISLINARILLEHHTGSKITASRFRERLIGQLLASYLQAKGIEIPRAEAGQRPGRRAFQPDLGRLEGAHFIEKGPTKLSCVACKRDGRTARVYTSYQCKTCPDHPALCLEQCFERYHTMDDYLLVRPPKQRRLDGNEA